VDDDHIVKALLAAAGLDPSPEEIRSLIAAYPTVKGMVDLLHSVQAARYADLCVTFRADATWVDWADPEREPTTPVQPAE
jgi:hypothetical protein